MNLVIDTNIVFSTLLNPHSVVGEILMNVQDDLVFFAPELLKQELIRYHKKIALYSKLDNDALTFTKDLVLSYINFVSEDTLSENSWIEAIYLTNSIDENDTPFVALAIELKAKIWTGDKVLSDGLIKKGALLTMNTAELKALIK